MKNKKPKSKRQIVKNWKKARRFSMIPRLLTANKAISRGAKSLAQVIANHNLGKNIFPSQKRMAHAIGISLPTVKTYLNELEAGYFIKTSSRKGKQYRSHQYTLTFPVITNVRKFVQQYTIYANNLDIKDVTQTWDGLAKEQKKIFKKRFDLFFMCLEMAIKEKKEELIDENYVDERAVQIYSEEGKDEKNTH